MTGHRYLGGPQGPVVLTAGDDEGDCMQMDYRARDKLNGIDIKRLC